jgi:TRAP-type C4-dicarboxylate transport system permease small subunit
VKSTADIVIAVAERFAAALLALVTVLTFVAVALRYVFHWAIPDSYDDARLLLGILIFWGIAVTGFRGEHITVDLLYNALPAPVRRGLDILATLFTLVCMAAFARAMGLKVLDVRASGEATFDTHTPIWPFYLVAWAGIAGSVLLLLIRLARQLRGGDRGQTPAVTHES